MTSTNTNGLFVNSSLWGPVSASSSLSQFISLVTKGPALNAANNFVATNQIQVVNTFQCDGICNAFEFTAWISLKLNSSSPSVSLYFYLALNPNDSPLDSTFSLGGWGVGCGPGVVTNAQMTPGQIRAACLTGQPPPTKIYLNCLATGPCQFDASSTPYIANYFPDGYGNSAAYVRGWVANIDGGN